MLIFLIKAKDVIERKKTLDGRSATFAKGETRFGLRSKYLRPESDRKGKRHLIAVRQVSLEGGRDRVTSLRSVIPSVCEPAFATQNSFEVSPQQ